MNDSEMKKLKILDELTIEIKDETHTLINPIKWIISNNWNMPNVEFCGYNVPHPSSSVINLSIQFENESDQTKTKLLTKIKDAAEILKVCCLEIINKL